MKILVDDETKLILGASLLGVGCGEVIHTLLDLMYTKAPFTVLQRAADVTGVGAWVPHVEDLAWRRPFDLASTVEYGRPKRPQKTYVNEYRKALQPSNPLKMIRQKLHLDQKACPKSIRTT
jgi:hypothetical protein